MDKVDKIVAENKDVWQTRSVFFSFIKGILRKGWSRHPVKIKLINKLRKQIPNPNPRGNKKTVWGATCSCCGNDFVLSQIEVDHATGETATLTELSHIQSCVEKLLCVVESDLRLLCKECHSIVSYSQKHGISFEEAQKRKMVIAFGKLPIDEMINILQNSEKYETIKEVVEGSKKLTKKRLCELYKEILNGSKEN